MDYNRAVRELAEKGIIVSKRMKALKISPHIYNVERVEKVIESIKVVCKQN